jgi:vesicle coat complex subunit
VTRLEQGIKSNLQQISSQPKEKIKEQIAAVDKEIKNGAQGQGLAKLQFEKSKLELLLNNPGKFKQESDQNLKQLQEQKVKAETQASEKMLKTGVRTGLASLLLAIAYVTIGWTGLRRVLK